MVIVTPASAANSISGAIFELDGSLSTKVQDRKSVISLAPRVRVKQTCALVIGTSRAVQHAMPTINRILRSGLALGVCGVVACTIESTPKSNDGGATSKTSDSAGAASSIDTGGNPAPTCMAATDACTSCGEGRCVPEYVGCISEPTCKLALGGLEGCLLCKHCDASCFANFAAAGTQGKLLTQCLVDRCSSDCATLVSSSSIGSPPLNAPANIPLDECKMDSRECIACWNAKCAAEDQTCLSDEACDAALEDAGDCLICNDCKASCLVTNNAKANKVYECLALKCSTECR
jgi:hypothetical protein